MKEIPLTQGKVALVDDEDFEPISQRGWYANKLGQLGCFYAVSRKGCWPNQKAVLMHRFILGAGKGVLVDHRDLNTLNNCRSNLRLCSRFENARNSKMFVTNTSGFRGVILDKPSRKWVAAIWFKNKRIHIGRFESKEMAAMAYNKKAKELHGEFATLNPV